MANVEETRVAGADNAQGQQEVAVAIPSHIQHPRFPDPFNKRYLMMYGTWITFLELKFINEKQSPFKTQQGIFCILSPLSLCFSLLISWVLSYLTLPACIIHKILTGLASFFSVLAQVLLLFVLFMPPKLAWIGYAVIGVDFVVVAAYTFSSDIKSLGNMIIGIAGVVKAKFEEKKQKLSRTTTIPAAPLTTVRVLRFNSSADLMEEAKDGDEFGLAGILVWMGIYGHKTANLE